ncbi:MAG: Rpp14/Pop5 family protein [Acidilobaceae archaeon]
MEKLAEYIEYLVLALVSLIGGAVGGALVAIRLKSKPVRIELSGLSAFEKRSSRKRRYIVFEATTTEHLATSEIAEALESTARRLLGDLGIAKGGFKLIDYDPRSRRGILRVKRDYKWHALAVLSLVRSISGKRVLLVPLFTTGTLRGARRRAGLARSS